jgi:simple sugar transport system permease protein
MSDTYLLLLSMAAATIRVAVPLVLAALAGLFAERAGVVDIGLEGKMLAAAFFAAAAASVSGSAWLGLAAGIAASIALALVHAVASVRYKGNQVVSGMAINILVAGLTPTLANAWFHQGGQTPLLGGAARFGAIDFPLEGPIGAIPVIGPLYREVIAGHNLLVYLAAAVVPLTGFVVYRTRFGLRLRAAGENPHALDTAGVSVAGMRYRAMAVTGLLCGIAGAYLSIAHNAGFVRDMTAGKGFLALAALIFGKWRPGPTLAACLLFAFSDALQIRLQGVAIPHVGQIPVQAIQALPYLLTILLLAGFVGRARAPKASGIPFVKDR